MKARLIFFYVCLVMTFGLSSCKKYAGEGGNSVIQGKIYVKNYNTNGTTLLNEYYGADVEVYIIYGETSNFYNERLRTSYDGSFEFRFLTKGKYRVFVYSKCFDCDTGFEEIIVPTEITKNKATVDLGNIVIND